MTQYTVPDSVPYPDHNDWNPTGPGNLTWEYGLAEVRELAKESALTLHVALTKRTIEAALVETDAMDDATTKYGGLPERVTLLDEQGQRGYRVEQTAGRLVRLWDYLNNREQMIFGDTGWRSIGTNNGWTGTVLVRREGSTDRVNIRTLNGASSTSTSFAQLRAPGFTALVTDLTLQDGDTARRVGINASAQMFIVRTFVQGSYWAELLFGTTDAWPSNLPGTASGTIPYQ